MTEHFQPTVGDIVVIPLDDTRVGFGQIAARKLGPNPDLFVVFDFVRDPLESYPSEELRKITQAPILFIANTFDALAKNGQWKIIGNLKPALERIPLPCYKVGSGHLKRITVESYDGKRRRLATKSEIAFLDNRGSVGPIRLEKALKAKWGLLPWDAKYERLTLDHVRKASQISFAPIERVLSIFK